MARPLKALAQRQDVVAFLLNMSLLAYVDRSSTQQAVNIARHAQLLLLAIVRTKITLRNPLKAEEIANDRA